jgi:hypothetical protein
VGLVGFYYENKNLRVHFMILFRHRLEIALAVGNHFVNIASYFELRVSVHCGLMNKSPALTRLQAMSPTHTFRTADLDLAHTSPSYTNDLYSYTIPACTVEAPDDG